MRVRSPLAAALIRKARSGRSRAMSPSWSNKSWRRLSIGTAVLAALLFAVPPMNTLAQDHPGYERCDATCVHFEPPEPEWQCEVVAIIVVINDEDVRVYRLWRCTRTKDPS